MQNHAVNNQATLPFYFKAPDATSILHIIYLVEQPRSIPLHKSRIAHNLRDNSTSRLPENPLATSTIRERSINVRIPLSDDGVALLVHDLAPERVLDSCGGRDGDFAEGLGRTHGDLLALSGVRYVEGDAEFDGLVGEEDADGVSAGASSSSRGDGGGDGSGGGSWRSSGLLEGRIADDGDDAAFLLELPLAVAAVGEGDVVVGAARRWDGVLGLVEQLAADVFVLDVLADEDVDGGEGACVGAFEGARGDASGGEGGVDFELLGCVGEDYGDAVVRAGVDGGVG